ncbi:uncharacterized protein LOC126209827 [Schistocerca nitens]|uniref:uncharacterized protein LOC126209827 n=1 Tax=Schistocerca nitens TaxID=7011 RepID=UPI002117A181|nr:uncharacterized protein LOC126209827 [Schistocerca nitens]
MDPAGVATSLLVLLAANNSSILDCVCNHVANVTDEMSYGDGLMWETYCQDLEFQAEIPVFLEHLSDYWRDSAQLLSLGVKHFSQLLVPLAFEHMGIRSNDLQRHGWIKSMKHLRDMLHTKLSGWVHDVQSVSEQMAYYKVEEHKNRPGTYILR